MDVPKGKVELIDNKGNKLVVDSVDAAEILAHPKTIYKLIDAGKPAEQSFDFAVRKIAEEGGFTGRAKVVKDTKEQAENYMLEKELDLDVYGIEERERK